MVRIAILASGSGTNAQRIVEYFNGHALVRVVLIGCDRSKAGVIQRSWDLGVPCYLFNGKLLRDGTVLRELLTQRIDLLVLAGFMRLIPAEMVNAFPDRIINIHPALLPNFGGKGMYGHRVHEAVIAAKEAESGITILFWVLLVFGTVTMIRKSLRMMYDGPMEAVLAVFNEMLAYGALLAAPATPVALALGGILGGMIVEWVSRRWS